MRVLFGTMLGAMLLASLPAAAGQQTVTLKVDMWCASCPYIVKQVLASVNGVKEVDVSYQEQTAVVTFDDEQTTVAALTQATSDVGFPAEVVQ